VSRITGLIFVILLFQSGLSYAETKYCENVYISDVWVEGARDDGLSLSNTLAFRIKDASGSFVKCEGKDYLHLENSSPAYAGMLSAALTAQTTNKVVDIAVNTSTSTAYSHQVAFIHIKSN
jgi:hypothetical protein